MQKVKVKAVRLFHKGMVTGEPVPMCGDSGVFVMDARVRLTIDELTEVVRLHAARHRLYDVTGYAYTSEGGIKDIMDVQQHAL